MNHIELNNLITQKTDSGFYDLEKDALAIEAFQKEVDENTVQFSSEINRLRHLVDENFYYNLFNDYEEDDILDCLQLLESTPFEFKSYMAISKFYKDYALKTNDKKSYLENYKQHVFIVALYLADGDTEKAKELIISMLEQRFQPATPTFLNAGRARRGELVSCFLLSMGDSLNSINYNLSTATQLSKIGGGVAVNLTNLRARGEAIKNIKGVGKGVVPVAKMLEMGFSYANQLGQRPGAGAVYLNVFHYDVLDFLDSKKINADEQLRLASISIGLIVPDLFIKLAQQNEDLYMFGPHSIFQEYGVRLDEIKIEEYYDKFVENPNIYKRSIPARELLNQIATSQLQSGYPYLMFKDTANKKHALKELGEIKQSNLCTEIFQLQETSIIKDYHEEDRIKRDISCNLGSLNIANVMETKKVKQSIYEAVDALTFVSDNTDITTAPGVSKANRELHSIGLGAMNLHGYLAKNKVFYESEEGRDFANTFFMMMNYYSLKKSMYIARDRGETFKDFEKSEYASGEYFNKYLENDYSPKTEKVKTLFEGIKIPSKENWERLKNYVMEHGLYNAYRLAIAPTQSISYVQNATPSVGPIVDLIERRLYGNAETYYPMPYLTEDNQWFYTNAYQMDQYKMIDMISTIQEHVDQGISTILYVTSNISTRELSRLYLYAHHKELKSLYYTRNKLLSVDECISCSV